MNKIVLAIALFCLFMNLYYFFYAKNLFLGSIAMVLTIAMNFIYATMNKVNIVDEEESNRN
jgi:ABC-type spermidine/putrescine transport system permease subunit II